MNLKSPLKLQENLDCAQRDIIEEIGRKSKTFLSACEYDSLQCSLVAYWRNEIPAALQDGPQCGIVALWMASHGFSSCPPSVADIQNFAAQQGYTKKGEMFSAQNMAAMSNHLFPSVESNVMALDQGVMLPKFLLKEIIQNQSVFLIPYDCDFNHGPCLKQGLKAHWAVIFGLLFIDKSINPPFSKISSSTSDYKIHVLDAWSDYDKSQEIYGSSTTFYLIGRQSKSKWIMLFDPMQLYESNTNLRNFGKSETEYVLPEEGMEAALANKIVRLRVPSH